MALQQGEVYRCSNRDCGCEITVTRGSKGGNMAPRCCCGSEMTLQEMARR